MAKTQKRNIKKQRRQKQEDKWRGLSYGSAPITTSNESTISF